MELENEKPNVYEKQSSRLVTAADEDEDVVDPFDEREVFGKPPACVHVICTEIIAITMQPCTQI